MSKRSRTFQPSATPPQPPDPDGQPPLDAATPSPTTPSSAAKAPSSTTPASASSRAEARRRGVAPKPVAQQSFFDRYKLLIIGGAGVVVALVAVGFLMRPSAAAFECASFLTPPPAGAPASGSAPTVAATPGESEAAARSAAPGAASSAAPAPAPAATPLLGFQTTDMGRTHVVQGTSVTYAYCPPASGDHYNLGGGQAPLNRRLYGPDDGILPQQWIHNLEHGYVVLLYRGEADQAVLDELQSIMDEAVVTAWSQENCGPVNKVIAVRFDDMDPGVNFAAVAWDRALLLGELDSERMLAFANQWQDSAQIVERVCG